MSSKGTPAEPSLLQARASGVGRELKGGKEEQQREGIGSR